MVRHVLRGPSQTKGSPGTYICWSLKQSRWRLLVQCTMMANEWPLMNDSLHLVLQTICVLSTPLSPYVKNLYIRPKILLHIRILFKYRKSDPKISGINSTTLLRRDETKFMETWSTLYHYINIKPPIFQGT